MTRKQKKLEIIKKLRDYICQHPEQRFGQALRNIGIVDTICLRDDITEYSVYFTNIFNEEPEQTLKRIAETLEKYGN